MTVLIQRLPTNVNYQETVEPSQSNSASGNQATRSPSRTVGEVGNLSDDFPSNGHSLT